MNERPDDGAVTRRDVGPTVDGVRSLILEPRPTDPDEISFGEPGRNPRAQARLFFRCGLTDEGVARLGLTALAVRMALAGLPTVAAARAGGHVPGRALETAVRVGLTTTVVEFAGSPDVVREGLAVFTERLSALDERQLEPTRRRLLAEEEQALLSSPVVPGAAGYFGTRGPGVTGFRWLGLATTDADELREWVRERLVAENAVLAADGLRRTDLRLALAHGDYRPERPAAVGVTRPTYARDDTVLLAFVAPRTWPSHLAAALLRLRCRDFADIAVSTEMESIPLGSDQLYVWVRVTPLPGQDQRCVDQLAGLVPRLVEDIPIALVAEVQASDWADLELSPEGVTYELAQEMLLGGEFGDSGSPRRIREVEPAQAREVLEAVVGCCLLTGPVPPRVQGWNHRRAPRRTPVRGGEVFASTLVPGRRLTLGPSAFAIDDTRLPGAAGATGRWDAVELALVGSTGGWIQLLLADGRAVRFARDDWGAPGREVTAAVRGHLSSTTPIRVLPEDEPRSVAQVRRPLDEWGRSRFRLAIFIAIAFGLCAALFMGLYAQAGGNRSFVVTTAAFAAISATHVLIAWWIHRRGGPQQSRVKRRSPLRIRLDLLVSSSTPFLLGLLAVALVAVPVGLIALLATGHTVAPLFPVLLIVVEIRAVRRVTREIRLRRRTARAATDGA